MYKQHQVAPIGRVSIEPQVTYLVKVNGFTKFQSNNYLDALEYLLQQRRSSCQKVYMTCREYEEGLGCM